MTQRYEVVFSMDSAFIKASNNVKTLQDVVEKAYDTIEYDTLDFIGVSAIYAVDDKGIRTGRNLMARTIEDLQTTHIK